MSASPPTNPDPAAPGRGWDPKVIFSVVAICFLFFVLSYYRILERIFFPCNHQVLRQPPYEANFEDPSLQYQSHGLDLPTLQSLPITQFRKKVIDEEEEQPRPSSMECAICLGEFDEGEWLKHLPSCKHVFHISCIDAWFQDHSNCPLCRTLAYGYYDSRSVCSESPSVSSHPLLEPLRREDFSRERQTHYQTVRSEILQNIDVRPSEPVAGNHPSS